MQALKIWSVRFDGLEETVIAQNEEDARMIVATGNPEATQFEVTLLQE